MAPESLQNSQLAPIHRPLEYIQPIGRGIHSLGVLHAWSLDGRGPVQLRIPVLLPRGLDPESPVCIHPWAGSVPGGTHEKRYELIDIAGEALIDMLAFQSSLGSGKVQANGELAFCWAEWFGRASMTAKRFLQPGTAPEYVGDCNISPEPVLSVANPVPTGVGAGLSRLLAPWLRVSPPSRDCPQSPGVFAD